MGVPKFYRWISERYPKINQVITDAALLPEFDHLYLDMNGIIHGCTHPSHLDISEVLSEKDMMLGIMHYIDRIVTQIVKPKVSLYMAIDGVAPRAKLNQQRSRRFRSAKDMAEATKRDKTNKDSSHTSGAFDSNCITPGTEFMMRVSNCIKYFIRDKIKNDPLWRSLKVIFSGHEIPGEGEHKIMEHIRRMKNQPGYRPNTRHCMYGQDADLIMLGLVSHEPHFTLLREIVDFGGFQNNNKNTLKMVKKFTKQSDFQLLHLSILREYLAIEFEIGSKEENIGNSSSTASIEKLEAIIDDFVFLTFLVGNDFLPHMPTLDIGENAFDLLFDTYRKHRRTWIIDQTKPPYLTNTGNIPDPLRLEAFLQEIGEAETDIFKEREINDERYLQKKRRWDKRDGIKSNIPTDAELQAIEEAKALDYQNMLHSINRKGLVKNGVSSRSPGISGSNEKDFKGRYYYEKLKLTPVDVDGLLQLRQFYVEGLLWCLAYYYKGCISWGWFYPYHYGPLLSDLKGLPEIFQQIKFEMGAPLKPFEQLMACLPPASSILVPKPYRVLMCSPESPIKYFYPDEFEVDMNGKKNPWEGVNLLPFIDVELLKKAISKHCPNTLLTKSECLRNSFGKVFCYTFDLTVTETIPSCNPAIGLPDIRNCNSRLVVMEEDFNKSSFSFRPELVPGTQIPYPGFPSLNVIPIDRTERIGVGLNCFGSASKYATTVLSLRTLPSLPPAAQLADKILGESLFINWPLMHEAKVVAVSDGTSEIRLAKGKVKKRKVFRPEECERWRAASETLVQQYLSGNGIPGSGGVNIGEIQIRLKLLPLQGMKTSPTDGSTKKVYGKEEADVPLQMVLWNAPAPDPRFVEHGPLTFQDRFPPERNLILTKGKYRGCLATVLGVAGKEKLGVRVKVIPPEPPFAMAIARAVKETFVPSSEAAKMLQLNPIVFGKIVGNISFDPGRYDLGLNLKSKDDLYVPGYSRKNNAHGKSKRNHDGKKDKKKAWSTGDSLLVVGSQRSILTSKGQKEQRDDRSMWEFTPLAIRLVATYRQKFPQIFAWISKYPNDRFYDAKKVFHGSKNPEEMLTKVRGWLNNVETANVPRAPTSTVSMSKVAIRAIEKAADVRVAQRKGESGREVNVRVPPAAIFLEGSVSPTDVIKSADFNDGSPPELGDRIANLCANGVPFGVRGTVVSIHDSTSGCVEVVMDEEFIGGSMLQGNCSNFRGKLCVWDHLLKISAADSNGVVDQMIPSIIKDASAKKEVAKAMKNQDNVETEPSLSSPRRDTQTESAISSKRTKSPKNSSSWSSPATRMRQQPPGGKGGGRQGSWKEALGPQRGRIGFRYTNRGVKNGYEAWRKIVTSSKSKNEKKKFSSELKAMLGVNQKNEPDSNVNSGKPNLNGPTPNATEVLKAKLGLGNIMLPDAPSAQQSKPPLTNSNLMSIPLPPPPQNSVSTATKVLEAIILNKSIPSPAMPVQQGSGFNFTYVEEGAKRPPSTHSSVPRQPSPHRTLPLAIGGFQQVSNGNPASAGLMPPPQQLLHPFLQYPPSTVIPREKRDKTGSIIPSVVVSKGKT